MCSVLLVPVIKAISYMSMLSAKLVFVTNRLTAQRCSNWVLHQKYEQNLEQYSVMSCCPAVMWCFPGVHNIKVRVQLLSYHATGIVRQPCIARKFGTDLNVFTSNGTEWMTAICAEGFVNHSIVLDISNKHDGVRVACHLFLSRHQGALWFSQNGVNWLSSTGS